MAYRLMDVLNSDLSLCGQGNLCSNANILKLSTYFPTFPIHAFNSECCCLSDGVAGIFFYHIRPWPGFQPTAVELHQLGQLKDSLPTELPPAA